MPTNTETRLDRISSAGGGAINRKKDLFGSNLAISVKSQQVFIF